MCVCGGGGRGMEGGGAESACAVLIILAVCMFAIDVLIHLPIILAILSIS